MPSVQQGKSTPYPATLPHPNKYGRLPIGSSRLANRAPPAMSTATAIKPLIDRPAQLYVLIDGRSDPQQFESLASRLIDAGVHVLQLRDKRLPDRQLVQRARLLRQLTRGTQTLCIINDRPDIALVAGSDGVHVGQDELCVQDARTIVGAARLVGVSTHSLQQARQAVRDGTDYIGCGPTFASRTKAFAQYPGPPLLQQVAADIRLPAFAIGGIRLDNVARVLRTGVTRIAVSAAVLEAADPAAAARALMARLADG